MKLTLPAPIQAVIGILNLTLGPEVLPKSRFLLNLSLFVFAFAIFLRQFEDFTITRAIVVGIVSAALLAAIAYVWAMISGYRERLTQTLTALAISGAVVIFITVFLRYVLIVAFAFIGSSEQDLPYELVVELTGFLLFPFVIWNVFVFAALFRRSFRPNVPVAFAVAILLVMVVDYWVPTAFPSL